MLWPLVSIIKISKNRVKIVFELAKRPQFPSDLVKNLEIPFPVVSRHLKCLVKRGIIECYNPNQKKGKIFAISKTGEKLIPLLKTLLNNS